MAFPGLASQLCMYWQTTRFNIDLSTPKVMGIVNATPDSFADRGKHAGTRVALAHCELLIKDGADILDIGGESSRPGAPPVPLDEELARVLPIVREAVKLGVPVSVDTYKCEVMQAALDLGADIINDIWALRLPGAEQAVASYPGCGVCLMHMHLEPQTMQVAPMEGDVMAQVVMFLAHRTQALIARGVDPNRIVWDAGTGFGKTVAQNFNMLARQYQLLQAGYPVLAGWSRKSSLGAVTGLAVEHRLVPSVAAALLSVERGASIVRVHAVTETKAALNVWRAATLAQPVRAPVAPVAPIAAPSARRF
jgi:dihydropteroate synthase